MNPKILFPVLLIVLLACSEKKNPAEEYPNLINLKTEDNATEDIESILGFDADAVHKTMDSLNLELEKNMK